MKTKFAVFFFASLLASAGIAGGLPKEAAQHIDGKLVEFHGICYFDDQGKLMFDAQKAKSIALCVVGVPPQPIKTVLVTDENGNPQSIIEFNLETKMQRTLWRKGQTML